MSIDSDVVKRGYLKVVASKGLIGSLTRFGTRKHWVVLRSESRTGLCRIEIYKDEDDVPRKNPSKIISVEQVSNLQTNLERKDITLCMFGETVTFGCASRADLDDWVRDIESLRQNRGVVSGKKTSHTLAPPDEDHFRVRLRQSTSLLFHGSCILEIQRDFERNLFHIAVFTEENPPRLIVKWQIDHIRQYGSNEVAFKFQSGSKSPTNVDWFIVDTDPGDAPKIHRAVDYWARHIVDQARNIPLLRRNSSTVSAGTPPRGDRLSQSVPPTSPPFVTRTPSVPLPATPTYMPLQPNTRQQTPIYDGIVIDNRQLPPSPSHVSSSVPTSANSVYQSLVASAAERNPTSSLYAGLNETTRDRQGSTNIRTNSTATDISPQGAEYMGLTSATRTNQDPTYMGISATKT